jgi:hypothetical protein
MTAPRTSGMAIASLILGCASFMCWIFTGLPAVILGIVSLRQINRSQGQLTGEGLAIGGIVTGGITSFMVVPIMVALLLPAVQAAREAARRNQSLNNIKQILLGQQNYLDTRGTFPAAGSKSGLSWRVHILPFIEEEALYKQFHLDEPWDSEHNRQLISQMPAVFENPGSEAPPGKTSYLAVTGPGTAFGDGEKGPTPRDISDGLRNTILIVEANPDQAVEWTKPDDWKFDPNNPMQGLGKSRPFGFLAGFGDAHTEFINADTDPEVVKALMTAAGREQLLPR